LCSAAAIPQSLTVDLSGFEVGDSIHISQIQLPDDATPTITDRDFTVATIAAPVVHVEGVGEGEEGLEAAEGEAGVEESAREETATED
jgi:large subunit ribosomal protein L25